MTTSRSTSDAPFCWQSKVVLRKIRDAFDTSNNVASAVATYCALTEIASDSQCETFRTTHAWIQQRSGCSIATIKRILGVFKELGLVAIRTPALRAPSEYTLLPLIANHELTIANHELTIANHELTIANHELTIANHELTIAHGPIFGERATLEESKKNTEESENNDAVGGSHNSSTDKPKSEKRPRARLPLLDALASVDGSNPAEVTRSAWSGIGKALSEIKEVSPDVSPQEIQRRARIYREHMPDATISPMALAKHWAKCDRSPRPGAPVRIGANLQAPNSVAACA